MNARFAATALVVAALAVPGVAAAKTPKFSFKKPSIVPGQSIGGVKVGMTKHQAAAAWGSPDRCVPFENVTWCQYLTTSSVPGGPSIASPLAGFFLKGSKVAAVEVELPNNNLVAKVKKLKTAKGVGLGSSAATVRAKYGIPTPPPGEATASHNQLRQGKRCTQLYAPQAPFTTVTDGAHDRVGEPRPRTDHGGDRMTRAARTVSALTTIAAIAFLLAPAASHARASANSIIQSDWGITSASGTQTLTMSGSDPGILDSFKAAITARWRTTTSRNHMLVFSWPSAKITHNFPDPATFATIDKVKVEMTGSTSGVFESAAGPMPFSCKENTARPVDGYLPAGGVPVSGGSLNATHLGMGALVRPDPRALFARCPPSGGLTAQAILSSEQIDVNKPSYTPVFDGAVKTGHKGKKMTLTIKVTEPIKSSAGAVVGKVVSKAFLHLRFVAAI
jgi:outer membrane protein assembly factor BamE (lipoprotein component of BamABCDE complex)